MSRVEQQQLPGFEHPAAAPERQRTASAIMDESNCGRSAIDTYDIANPANALPGLGGNMLQQWYVFTEISARRHPAAKVRRRRDRDQRTKRRIAVCLYPI
ncbi:MAG: hypothetical protein Q27BB25_12960 [Blastomonas sp. CACIA14H2]|nr:MAG: hypothetical protein Q27BB25_12960 [Blastomonas sp. CACIA14H2]